MTKKIKKITIFIIVCMLLATSGLQSFAVDTQEIHSTPLVNSTERDIIIDTSEVTKFLNSIDDKEKRTLIEEYISMPVKVVVSNTPTKDISKMTVPKEIQKFADLSIAEIKAQYDSMLEINIKEINTKANIYPTEQLITYIEETNPTLANTLYDTKPVAEQNIEVSIEGNEVSAKSVISKHYYKELSYVTNFGNTYLKGSCEVDWTYDSSTKKIYSLYPETTFWYTGAPFVHLFGGFTKNTQYLNTMETRGYVQKAREMYMQSGTGYLFLAGYFVFNLVFSPYATNSLKTFYNQTEIIHEYGYSSINWGGGY